jgi:hypothetical protein
MKSGRGRSEVGLLPWNSPEGSVPARERPMEPRSSRGRDPKKEGVMPTSPGGWLRRLHAVLDPGKADAACP